MVNVICFEIFPVKRVTLLIFSEKVILIRKARFMFKLENNFQNFSPAKIVHLALAESHATEACRLGRVARIDALH